MTDRIDDKSGHDRRDARARLEGVVGDPDVPDMLRAAAMATLVSFVPPKDIWTTLAGVSSHSKVRAGPALRAAAAEALATASAFPSTATGASAVTGFVDGLLASYDDPGSTWVRAGVGRHISAWGTMEAATEVDAARNPEWQKAVKAYKDSLSLGKDQAPVQVILGNMALNRGDVTAAEAAYRRGIRLDPDAAGARTALAQLMEDRGRSNIALTLRREERALLERDIRLLPDAPQLRYRLGLLCYLLKDNPAAVSHLTQAVDLAPSDTQVRMGLVLLLEALGKRAEAVVHARKLLALAPEDPTFRALYARLR